MVISHAHQAKPFCYVYHRVLNYGIGLLGFFFSTGKIYIYIHINMYADKYPVFWSVPQHPSHPPLCLPLKALSVKGAARRGVAECISANNTEWRQSWKQGPGFGTQFMRKIPKVLNRTFYTDLSREMRIRLILSLVNQQKSAHKSLLFASVG